jgi:membrane protein
VLGAQAFSALFPLLIVYAAMVAPEGRSGFAERVIDRFDLRGDVAEDVHTAFAPPETVEHSVTAIGVVLLVISALAFARAMQRVFERAWGLEPLGVRASGWGLLWLAGLVLYFSARQAVDGALTGPLDAVVSIALGTLVWTATPLVLLARRLHWRALLPGAAVTAVAMTALSVAAVLLGPRTIASSAVSYGLIGIAFALSGWLVVYGIVIAATAALGAVIAETAGLVRERS